MRKIIVILGKGGVGKTTISLALARAARDMGLENTLLVSLDPAHNIGDLLGIKLAKKPLQIQKGLKVWEVDPDEAVTDYLETTRRKIESAFRNLKAFNLDGYIDVLSLAPGTLEQAYYLVLSNIFKENVDLLVLDMPPTGLALRILALPWVNAYWLEKLIEIRTAIWKRRLQLQKIKKDRREEDEILEELRIMKKETAGIIRIIESSLIIPVLEPEKLSIEETKRCLESLALLGLRPRFYIINKVGMPIKEHRVSNLFPELRRIEIPWFRENVLENITQNLYPLLEVIR